MGGWVGESLSSLRGWVKGVPVTGGEKEEEEEEEEWLWLWLCPQVALWTCPASMSSLVSAGEKEEEEEEGRVCPQVEECT